MEQADDDDGGGDGGGGGEGGGGGDATPQVAAENAGGVEMLEAYKANVVCEAMLVIVAGQVTPLGKA